VAHSVPIIDITGLRSGNLAERTRVAREIGGACETIGFFGITGHGVDPRLLDDVFDATRRVFDLPKEEKMAKAWDDDHVNRGYDPAGNQALDEGTPPDLKEAWAFSPENSAGSSPMQGENQWPDLDEVRTPVTAYHAAAMELGALMLRAMALSLGLAEDHFQPFHTDPTCTLRLLHYPARPDDAPDEQLGTGAHTDWGAVTVLAQDDAGSLQVRAKDDTWVDVPSVPGAFVINVGDLLQRWTNDRYVSTMHRVIGVPGRSRYSVACFFDLDHDALVECLPTCTGPDDPPRHPPVLAGEHLRERYLASLS